jgi:septal ring factor EnvC (AmiA/AmiB activator)
MRLAAALFVIALATGLAAQTGDRPPANPQAQRVNERIRALQSEADRLATQARTLLGELRKLEIERDLEAEQFRQAQADVSTAQSQVDAAGARLAALEQVRIAQLPDVKAQLVDIYKRGRAGYARMIFGARSARELGRATRAVAALVKINQERITQHQRTLEALRGEREGLQRQMAALQTAEREARRARDAAERAVAARSALITQIDARRDLNAQFAGELQVAYERLQRQTDTAGTGRLPVTVPLAPFRGALDWPVSGTITGRYGQPVLRAGASVTRNGIEVAAGEGTPVLAVHPGTVSYADVFSGFGTLVIVDHGGNDYSLYGYLGSASVREGDAVDAGAEVGRTGLPPAGPPSLYFEIRIDGRSVDPVQWLRPR